MDETMRQRLKEMQTSTRHARTMKPLRMTAHGDAAADAESTTLVRLIGPVFKNTRPRTRRETRNAR